MRSLGKFFTGVSRLGRAAKKWEPVFCERRAKSEKYRALGDSTEPARARWRKLAGDDAGSPAVEFALVFPIFIAIVLATLQAGTIFLVKAFFESGAEQAARVVLTDGGAI
jgi:hypothetical protein